MRFRTAVLAVACLAVGVLPSAAAAKKAPKPSYYLSLGDSLAQGVQPNPSGKSIETNQGYADDLFSTEKTKIKGLKLAKLGCPGESTTSMINGGPFCKSRPYSGAQLAAALKFIAKHKVALITLDIGANDVDGCATASGSVDAACLAAGIAAIKANTPRIVKALRHAVGPKVRIAGMTYYDPILSEYLGNAQQKSLATLSVGVVKSSLNDALITAFQTQHVKVADVATAFDTYTPFITTATLAGHGTVPLAVAQVCRLTWACTPKPRGPNIHANRAGYEKIAKVFAAAL